LKKNDWFILAGINIAAIIFFFLLYEVFPYKPYSNMAYFFLMAVAGVFYAQKYSLYEYTRGIHKTFLWSLIGSVIMLSGYGLVIAARAFVLSHPKLVVATDPGQWSRFVGPWLEINRVISILGIILVVFATEYFYRAYMQPLLEKAFNNPWYALFVTSALSGLRGIGGGGFAGPFDFLLSLLWGWIYIQGGLVAALVTHMVWDIFFVYFAK